MAATNKVRPRASVPFELAKEILVDDRLLVNGLLSPVYSLHMEQQVLQGALNDYFPTALVRLVAKYLGVCTAAAGPFAKGLYDELHVGNFDTFTKVLYDAQGNALQAHYFWDHLAKAKGSVQLAFVQILWVALAKGSKAEWSKGLVELVSRKLPQMAYFARSYAVDHEMNLLFENVHQEEWPQVLTDGAGKWKDTRWYDFKKKALYIQYLLARRMRKQLKTEISFSICQDALCHVIRILHASRGTLLCDFFRIGLEEGSFMNEQFFNDAPVQASRVDHRLCAFLRERAVERGWRVPALSERPFSLVPVQDGAETGNVHMQPLQSFASSLATTVNERLCAVSPSGKTVMMALATFFIAPGNMLHVLPEKKCLLCVRSFAEGRVQAYSPHAYKPVRVQHGDVIAWTSYKSPPFFLSEQIGCAGVSRDERFESLKTFCYLAKSHVDFIAIVEDDEPAQEARGAVEPSPTLGLDREQERGTGERQREAEPRVRGKGKKKRGKMVWRRVNRPHGRARG